MIVYGRYPGIKLPAIPGSDGAGQVIAVGDEVKGVLVGDEVIINPGLNWGSDINKKALTSQFLVFLLTEPMPNM